jgi:hypothetical protein
VAQAEEFVAMRDSVAPDGPFLRFSRQEWESFIAGVRDDEFSH